MNNEPIKFLPQDSMAQTYLKGFTPTPTANAYRSNYSHAETIVNRIEDNADREYMAFFVARNRKMDQQNWDLKIALDRQKELTKALIWVASLGWFTASILFFNAVSRF